MARLVVKMTEELRHGCRLQKITVAHIAQSVEHFLGKEEVTGSNPVVGSNIEFIVRNYEYSNIDISSIV